VDGHWRQTPYFQELVFWELQEESARLAGFQTGHLDTFTMAIDSIPLVESIPGAKLMRVPGGPEYALQIFGNYHVEALAGNPPAAFNPELPWISASADLDSDEWQRAVKVRQALIMAIDREAIIDTILGGNARPGILWFWSLHAERLGERSWEYNPERARELLAEAGYPGGGFSITLSPTIRAAPSEVELCEAIATMWDNELGLRVRLERIPFSVFAAQRAARTYVGATCHATSPRMVVGAQAGLTTLGAANFGATHPFLEEITPRIAGAVDDAERERLEDEMGAFLFDNALTTIGLFDADTVWPVGPNIEEWREHVKTKDVLRINGYEYIQPRQ
jgi:ABC-type transport system substrate-binding protein